MRSMTAPEKRATVMPANIAWKAAKSRCGSSAEYVGLGAPVTPANPTHSKPPIQDDPGPKARLYPIRTHWTVTTPSAPRLMSMVLRALLVRTRPP